MNVTWLSPSSGETYTPGQSITGKWMTGQSLSNPAFRLCSADGAFADDPEACGQAIWPPVQQTNSSYQVSLAVPDVSTTSEFYLIMEDNRGNTFSSPVFSLSSSHQEPQEPSQSPERSEAQNEDPPSLQSFSPLDNINAEVAAPDPVAAPPSTTSPLLSQNRIPIPVAAYAVPLAVAGIIILVGLIVLIVQRRKLHLERSIPNPQSATSKFFTRAQTIMRPIRKEKQAFYSNHTNIADSPMMRSVNEKSHQAGVERDSSDIFTSVYLPILSRKRTATREPFKQHYINPIPIPIPPSGLVQHDNSSTSRSAMSRIAVPARIIRAATSRFISSRFYRRGEGNVVEVQRVEKIQGQGQAHGQTHLRPSHQQQQQQPRIHPIRRDRREDREVDVDSIMSHYMDASPELDHLEEVDLRNMEHTPDIRQPQQQQQQQQQQHSYVLPMPKDVHLRREASDRDDVWFVEFDSESDHHVPVRDAHAARYEREYR